MRSDTGSAMASATTTTVEPPNAASAKPAIKPGVKPSRRTKRPPLYNVILLDDDDHTYDYVIGMLTRLFGFPEERSFALAAEVDGTGRVIIDTTTLERAELKRDQIHAFGRDWRITHCAGSMTATLEPVAG